MVGGPVCVSASVTLFAGWKGGVYQPEQRDVRPVVGRLQPHLGFVQPLRVDVVPLDLDHCFLGPFSAFDIQPAQGHRIREHPGIQLDGMAAVGEIDGVLPPDVGQAIGLARYIQRRQQVVVRRT
jgi:hypothetical protein